MLQTGCPELAHSDTGEQTRAESSRKSWSLKQAELVQTVAPLAFGFDEAVVAARTNRKRLRRALNSGELPAFKDGKKLIIIAADLIAWRRSLPAYRGGVSPIGSKAASASVAA